MKQPVIKFISDRQIKLVKDFTVKLDTKHQSFRFTVPKGYISDGCSIPKIFWGFPFYFTPFQGKTLPAALIHDIFYSKKIPTKIFADIIFYKLLKKYKVPFLKRALYFKAVFLFGRYK